MNKFICIEGVNATGKSTICAALAKILKFTYYKTPGGPFGEVRTRFEDINLRARYFFYRGSNSYDSEQIRQILQESGVVCDRYFHSTQIAHSTEDEDVSDLFDLSDLLMPDYTIILSANEETRKDRLASRSELRSFEQDLEHQRKANDYYVSLGYPVVDNSNRQIQDVCNEIIELIQPL